VLGLFQVNAMVPDAPYDLVTLGYVAAGAATAGAVIGLINLSAMALGAYMGTGSNSCESECNAEDKSIASPLVGVSQDTCALGQKSS